MLPASKAVPKELLPLADKPILQYAVEEAVAAGVRHIVFVISEGKEAIREHFTEPSPTTTALRRQGRTALADVSASPAELAEVEFAYQYEARGIAHALQQAEDLVRGEAIAVFYPDDVILGERSCLGELIEAYERRPGTVLAVQEVAASEVSNYGIVDPAGEGDPVPLKGVVEKPRQEDAPSRLAIVGRLVLPRSIFGHIANLKPGAGGELQLTDAVEMQIAAGEPVSAAQFSGMRFDTGRPPGYVAANVAAALIREDLRDPTLELFDRLTRGS
jgi:UTP--glucose-1-phosphate uridylyltransferase